MWVKTTDIPPSIMLALLLPQTPVLIWFTLKEQSMISKSAITHCSYTQYIDSVFTRNRRDNGKRALRLAQNGDLEVTVTIPFFTIMIPTPGALLCEYNTTQQKPLVRFLYKCYISGQLETKTSVHVIKYTTLRTTLSLQKAHVKAYGVIAQSSWLLLTRGCLHAALAFWLWLK